MENRLEISPLGFIYLDEMTLDRLRRTASRVGDWAGYDLWDQALKAKFAAHSVIAQDSQTPGEGETREQPELVDEPERADPSPLYTIQRITKHLYQIGEVGKTKLLCGKQSVPGELRRLFNEIDW